MKTCQGLVTGESNNQECRQCGHTYGAHSFSGKCDICSVLEAVADVKRILELLLKARS